jgi:hypothetical protein
MLWEPQQNAHNMHIDAERGHRSSASDIPRLDNARMPDLPALTGRPWS